MCVSLTVFKLLSPVSHCMSSTPSPTVFQLISHCLPLSSECKMTTIPEGELFYSTYYSACIRTLHKMKAQLVYASLCGNITADTSTMDTA